MSKLTQPNTLPGWTVRAVKSEGLTDCTLIIPTYKRPREMATLLTVISSLADHPRELVIADASPDRDTENAVREFTEGPGKGFDVTYARCPAGLTRQRNIAIELSSKEFVFFLDDDCHPQASYFSAVRNVFVNDTRREIGAVGGAVLNEMNRPMPRRWRIRLALGLAPKGNPLTYYQCGTSVPRGLLKPFTGIRPATVLPGCAMAFRRDVLMQERFSEFFYGYAQGEDLEMSLRVARRWSVVCCGDAAVLHHHAPGGRPASFSKGRMEIRNKYFIWNRHVENPPVHDRIRFWADAGFLVAMDCLTFVTKPWTFAPLAHASGLVRGIADCIFSGSGYSEPSNRINYRLASEDAR